MLVVIALGGNALIRRGQAAHVDVQRRNVAAAVRAVAEIARDHDVVVTHGNGPQVGLLALQTAAYPDGGVYPLDVLDAESAGMIGYLLEMGLENRLPGRPVATLLTQVSVDPRDPAFASPSKPVGPMYGEAEAHRLAAERGWAIAPDGVAGWRRVVASPAPRDIVELRTIRLLVDAGVLVVCVGGGGIPVVVEAGGRLRGVEAVIDKDRASALLAQRLHADALLILTDVDGVQEDFGTPSAHRLPEATPAQLRTRSFAAGSMGPKVEAACRFVELTGNRAGIGRLEDAAAVLAGTAGTTIVPSAPRRPLSHGDATSVPGRARVRAGHSR